MELKIRHKTEGKAYKLIRYTAIVVLPVLLTFYIFKFKSFNAYLISINPGINRSIWIASTKFLSYCLHILMNFCILLAITRRLRYSLVLVYVSFLVLLAGAFMVMLRDTFGIPLPLTFIAFFVKLNKSLILLILFIAGHFVQKMKSSQES